MARRVIDANQYMTLASGSQALSAVSPMLRIRNGSRNIMPRVIDLPDIVAAALTLLTVALFAAMIWAGNHQH